MCFEYICFSSILYRFQCEEQIKYGGKTSLEQLGSFCKPQIMVTKPKQGLRGKKEVEDMRFGKFLEVSSNEKRRIKDDIQVSNLKDQYKIMFLCQVWRIKYKWWLNKWVYWSEIQTKSQDWRYGFGKCMRPICPRVYLWLWVLILSNRNLFIKGITPISHDSEKSGGSLKICFKLSPVLMANIRHHFQM